ncbi:MAG: hypothetical protein PHO63_04400 [Bacilli bacterium]|nr:hypothetical protein [Bacilli bacterium]MDD4809305.1 hypothetical protein [Bacilli bacterium]
MMNYIYDILINFNYNLYEFYDWNKEDNIINVKSVLIFKIRTDDLNKITNNIIKVDEKFLNRISNKTEYFSRKAIGKIKYACLFSDGIDVVALKFSSNGESVGISKLVIEEELEIIEVIDLIKDIDFSYEIIKKREGLPFKTRKEIKDKNDIVKEVNQIDDLEKLKYLYFECFNEEEEKKEIILEKLLDESNLDKNLNKIKEILKLVSIKTTY